MRSLEICMTTVVPLILEKLLKKKKNYQHSDPLFELRMNVTQKALQSPRPLNIFSHDIYTEYF